jgi:hypothetical protein
MGCCNVKEKSNTKEGNKTSDAAISSPEHKKDDNHHNNKEDDKEHKKHVQASVPILAALKKESKAR